MPAGLWRPGYAVATFLSTSQEKAQVPIGSYPSLCGQGNGGREASFAIPIYTPDRHPIALQRTNANEHRPLLERMDRRTLLVCGNCLFLSAWTYPCRSLWHTHRLGGVLPRGQRKRLQVPRLLRLYRNYPPHSLNFVNTYPTQEQVIAAATKKDTSLVNPQHYAAYLRQELTDILYIMR